MNPVTKLPKNYKLLKVFELDNKKSAKKNILIAAYALFFLTSIPFFIHFFAVLAIANFSSLSFLSWVGGMYLILIVIVIGTIQLERLFFILLTREKPSISFDKFHLYTFNRNWYFPRKQALQTFLLPEIIFISVFAATIPFMPFYFVSVLLFAIPVVFTFSFLDFVLSMYLFRLPANTLVHQNQSRIEIYLYNNASEKGRIKETESLKTAVSTQPNTDDIYLDLKQLKKKENQKK